MNSSSFCILGNYSDLSTVAIYSFEGFAEARLTRHVVKSKWYPQMYDAKMITQFTNNRFSNFVKLSRWWCLDDYFVRTKNLILLEGWSPSVHITAQIYLRCQDCSLQLAHPVLRELKDPLWLANLAVTPPTVIQPFLLQVFQPVLICKIAKNGSSPPLCRDMPHTMQDLCQSRK